MNQLNTLERARRAFGPFAYFRLVVDGRGTVTGYRLVRPLTGPAALLESLGAGRTAELALEDAERSR